MNRDSWGGGDFNRRDEYMEHPYHCYRQDNRGAVNRACFRYLADALRFVGDVIKAEVNPCLWRVRNEESGHLCARLRYQNGQVTREV